MTNILDEILAKRKKTLENDIKSYQSLIKSDRIILRKSLSENIRKNNGISIISEIKPSSPSLGDIRNGIDIHSVAIEMESAGVVGLSVLTEPNYFKGSFSNLKLAVNATEAKQLPCLMKDFVFDEAQFRIARQIGASNILLINYLGDLERLYGYAIKYGIEPLIEIHDVEEIKVIRHLFDIGLKPNLFGVNNRNLKTMEIDLNISLAVIPKLKEEFGEKIQVVSESGIKTVEDIKYIQPSGADAFLIGSSIMQSSNIKEKILELRGEKV